MKLKFYFVSIALVLILAACGAPTSPTVIPESKPLAAPSDTPAPAEIDAPIVETPALVSINMLNEKDGWGITETQVVRTNDGGITWYNVTAQGLAEVGYNVSSFFLDVEHGWLLLPDEFDPLMKGLLYRTSDGGLTWKSNPVPFGRGDMTFLDPSNAWVLADLGVGAGSNAVAVYQTNDSGGTWSQTYINDPTEANAGDSLPLGGLKMFLTPLSMQTAWVGGIVYSDSTVYLYRSDDGGKNWSKVSLKLPPEAQANQLVFESMEFVSSKDGFLLMRIGSGAGQQVIYVTQDGGETWSLTPTLIPQGGSADFTSEKEAVVFTGEKFYVTKDGAQTWSTIAPDVVFGDSFSSMDFANATTGWVLTADPNNHYSLYKSTDGGATWTPILP